MEEYRYSIISPDGTTMFNKREIKLIDNLLDKFTYQDEIEIDYSKHCMEKISEFLGYYLSLSKNKQIKLTKSGTLSGQSIQERDMYNWMNNWIDTPELLRELSAFMIEYDTDLYVDILAMEYVKDMEVLSPMEFAQKHSEYQNMDEDEKIIADEYVDWLSDF